MELQVNGQAAYAYTGGKAFDAALTGAGPDPHAKPEVTDEELLLEELKHEAEEREAKAAAVAAPAAAGAKP